MKVQIKNVNVRERIFFGRKEWRKVMGVEPTRERWRPQQDLKSLPPSPEMTTFRY